MFGTGVFLTDDTSLKRKVTLKLLPASAFSMKPARPLPPPACQGDICKVSSMDKVGRSDLEESIGLAVMLKCAAPSNSAA